MLLRSTYLNKVGQEAALEDAKKVAKSRLFKFRERL